MVKSLVRSGHLKKDKEFVLDNDNQFIAADKYERVTHTRAQEDISPASPM